MAPPVADTQWRVLYHVVTGAHAVSARLSWLQATCWCSCLASMNSMRAASPSGWASTARSAPTASGMCADLVTLAADPMCMTATPCINLQRGDVSHTCQVCLTTLSSSIIRLTKHWRPPHHLSGWAVRPAVGRFPASSTGVKALGFQKLVARHRVSWPDALLCIKGTSVACMCMHVYWCAVHNLLIESWGCGHRHVTGVG